MNRILGIGLLITGCQVHFAGQCTSNADCTDPATCDTSQHVCVVPQGGCYPLCSSGQACVAGICQTTTAGGCTPACPSDQACVNNSCQPVSQASVVLTSPKPNDYVGATVQASAVAYAPGGVSSVRFELRSTAGAVIASATATVPASGSSFAASIPLTGISFADGPAVVVAVLTYAGGSKTSAPQSVNIDRTPPVVNLATDTNWYARTVPGGAANMIVVNAAITDAGSGVASAFLQVGTGPKVAGTFVSPNWQFLLDATQATQGAEAPLAFTIGATDNVGNQATPVGGSSNVDDVAPLIAHVKVYLAGATPPGTDGVTPPLSGSFLYSDNITISGELTDSGAGLAVSPAPPIPSYVLTGVGGAALPAVITGCTAGQTTKCTFTVSPVSLRNAPFIASSGNMTLTIAVDDLAKSGNGAAQPHHATFTTTAIPVTRLKWKLSLSAVFNSISGLAVHPDGDVIVTGVAAGGSTDTIYAILPDGTKDWQAGTDWYSTGSHLGRIDGSAAIGAGNTPNIYVATTRGDLVAVTPGGLLGWECGTGAFAAMHNAPAVVSVSSPMTCEAAFAGNDNHRLGVACSNTAGATTCTSQTLNLQPNQTFANASGAIFLSPNVYLGENNGWGVFQVPLAATTNFVATATPTPIRPTAVNTVTNLLTDGTQAFGIDAAAQQVYGLLPTVWTTSSITVNGTAAIEPSSGGVIVNEADMKLHSLSQATGVDTTLTTSAYANNNNGPLLGSDGYLYFGSAQGVMFAVQDPGYTTAWSYNIGTATNLTVPPNIDCNGVLYFVGATTVYALITDSHGLRDSPWPKFQRDSRNSGNASAGTKWGMRTASGCVQ